jgi:malate permease and related proteins
MTLFLDILRIVLPVFLVIGLGFFLKRISFVDSHFIVRLNRLIYYIALPALLFYNIAIADFSASFNSVLLLGLLASAFLTFLLSYGYAVLRGYSAEVRGSFCQGSFRGNLAYIGLAIIFNAFGEEELATAGILLGFVVPFFNFLAIIALLLPHRHLEQRMGVLFWLRQLSYNPLILSSFAGILWSYLQVPMPQVLASSLDIISGMALPLALLAIGASFSFEKLRGDLSKALIATAIKIVWLPMCTAILLLFLGIRGRELAIGVIFAGTPTATAAYIMAQQMKGDAELSGSIIMLTTILSIFTYTAALYTLQWLRL